MTSLKDIASELNVSPSLVSKVLNDRLGNTGARPDTIQAIRDKALQLGYRKNVSAVALRAGRQQTIGVFIHRMGSQGSGLVEALLEGISEQVKESQYRLMLHFFETSEEFRELRQQLHGGVIDGLLLGGIIHQELEEDIRYIQQLGIPVVSVYDTSVTKSVANIGMNQVEVGRVATAHLIERGCKRIAHLHQDDERYEGYRKALQEAGIEHDKSLVYYPKDKQLAYRAIIGEEAMKYWLANNIRFDGLFVASDEPAMGSIKIMIHAGIQIPDQIRVIGVDNAPYCQFAIVPLSSVCQRFRERGRRAVRCLLQEGGNTQAEPCEALAPVLYARESTK